jgi:hypothetical protein
MESTPPITVNTYKISRQWFDWCFENPDKAKPPHGIIYFFALDQNNRFGWKEKFGFPALHAMEATGIKSKNTYYKAFHDLVEWDFLQIINKSKNQNTANIISIPAVSKFKSAGKSAGKSALDSANIQQEDSGGNVDKQLNKEQLNKKQESKENPLAFEFLRISKSEELNIFEMQNKKQIENWQDLIDSFNDTVEIEISKGKIDFEANQLLPRFRKYTRSWISNQGNIKTKVSSHKTQKNGIQEPTINRQTAGTIDSNLKDW